MSLNPSAERAGRELLAEDRSSMLDDAARDAFREALSALDEAEAQGEPMGLCQALGRVGRCYHDIGAAGPAENYLQQGLRLALSFGAVDASVDLLCELAEVAALAADQLTVQDARAAHGARNRARDHAFEAARLAGRSADPQWEVTVLLRISEVLDSLGDRDDAIALQCRALGLMAGAGPEAPAKGRSSQPALRT